VNGGTGASTFNDVMIGGIGGWSVGEAHRLNFVYNTASSPTILGTIETEYTASGQAKMHFRNLFNTAPQTSYVMTLQGNGNVGIGTTSPSQKLEVVGNTTIVDSVSIYGGNYNFMNNPSYPVRLAVGNGTNNISAYFNASMMGLFSDITDNYPTEGGTFGLSGRVVNDTGGTVVQALSAGYLSSKGWYGLRAVYQNATSTRTVYLATNDHAGYFDGNVSVTGNVSVGARILNADGSASAPSYSFANDLDTGMFRVTDNAVSFAVLGSERARIDNTYLRIPTVLIPMNSNAALIMNGYIDDGASAVGVKIGNMNSLDTAGAKIVSFYKDSSGGASSEKASIDKDGSANFSGNVTAAGNISFDGEIMPDGALCSNNQILKKTAANDWDCATDVGGSGMSGFTAAGDAGTPQAINNSDTLTIAGGTGITTSAGATDTVTITNSDRGSSQNIFKSISNGSHSAVADLNSDTLTLGGNGITTVSCTNDPDECIIAATEVDGSVTNEAQTLSSSGATPNMQIDLSTAGGAGGGSVTCQTLTGGSGLCDGTDATGILAEDDPYVDTVTNTYVCYGNGASHVECNDNAFYWDTSNKLGIGTTNPASMLHLQGGGIIVNQSTAVQAAPSGTAIYGTGSTFGIYGQYSVGTTNYGYLGSNGRGVYGDGSSYGVYGYGLNIAGIYGTAGTGAGVLGNRSATGISVVNGAGVQGSGSTYGVYGSYNSQNYGFLGNSSTGVSGRGDNYGVYGEGGNFGVYGQAGASTEAVRGQYDADTYGWLGSSTIGAGGAYDASNYGYVGLSSGGNGYGVYGVGGYVGVYGIRGGGGTADSGSGVYGTGSTTGVVGEYSDTLRGYLGSSTYGAYGQYDGNRYGYLGSSVAGAYGKGQYNSNGFLGADNIVSNAGFGVLGNSSGTVGLYNYGVYGKADLTNDYNIGVVGSVDTSTNYFAGTYGIYGRYDSNNYGYLGSNGYGVYGKGGTNGVRGEDATSATRFGYLGSQNYAVYGQYDGDTYGYFASSSVGAYAQVDASNYAYLGYSSYGTYGVGSDSGVVGLRGSATVSWPNVGVYGGYDADTFGFLGGGLTGVVGQGEGNVYGGLGYAAAANANYGAYGYAVNGSNTINYGMYGGANLASSNNIGVLGQANSSSGYAVGVMGYSGTSAAVTLPSYDLAGYFYGMPVVIGTYSANVNATNINGDGDLYVLGEVEIDGLAQATSAYTLYYQQGGRITRTASSRKFKEDIWDYSFDIEKLKKLRPVTFTYNNLSGAPGTKSFGLIAEEVDEVFPELVGHDENGSADTVAYDHIGVTLIKVAQEQQKKIEAQQEEINLLKAENSQRQQELTELKTAIGQIQQQLQTKN
jgi:hypothetical protein